MLFVLLAICVVMVIVAIQRGSDFLLAVAGVGGGIVLVFAVAVLWSLVDLRPVDDRIAMYRSENVQIEGDLHKLIEEYLLHENKTFAEARLNAPAMSSTMAVQLYPNLVSGELVKSQLAVYVKNNDKLKELQSDKLKATVYKWWLWFGK